jgi:serine/threonine-protein kinase
VTSSPSPKGTLLHRLCPSCDIEILEERTTCPDCGSKLVEVRDEIDTTVGTVIDDRFEVRAKVGQGGMGTVYRAWQKSIGREVAIKLMDRSYSRDTMAVRRFLREARLASQLSQPNTVSVFDFGQAGDGRLFIAMELIRGRTLHQVVQAEGAFSVERCVRIGIQICDALEAAHAIGIVHRDLKLENVIVLDHPPGRDLIKVLDFGLAKNIRDPGSRATESGIVVGTPRYMSPEAATTGTTGPEGDCYSVGVIIGELAAGKPMWTGETLSELITQKMDPRAAVQRAPAALRPLLERLLDPEPERRPTPAQMRTMLTNAASGEPGAGETILDPEAGATTNIRTPSGSRAADPGATRQLSPEPGAGQPRLAQLALAPTGTPMPRVARPGTEPTVRAQTSPGDSSARTPQGASPSLVELDRPPVRRWPVVVIGLGALGAVVATIVIATRGDEPDKPQAAVTPQGAAVTATAATAPTAPLDAAPAAIAIDAGVSAPVPTVTIRVTSEPAGATVTYRNQTATTPFSIVVEKSTEPIALVGKLAGRLPTTIKVVPDKDRPAVLKLRAKPAKGPSDEDTPF